MLKFIAISILFMIVECMIADKLEALLSEKNDDDKQQCEYGTDKENKDDGVLSNKEKYNIYSPKHKKWYWVNFDPADGKDMVATFSIYPGKSSEAL